ncbi:MAG: uracil-DNA glycosylase [Candidatus Kapabacteria bacterium]|nr:uracil-DNA glycosylase [Candidatus Kapabacteria bacterium]MDW8012743.1 uracil-DNA glycosylase [Bacteroidota bacterium]
MQEEIVACERCPRLRQYCQEVAYRKRAAYRDWKYWGRPVPNTGSPSARLLIVGLAPAAHGANRTGRMFTGDRSGQFLYRALYETGFANQPESYHRGDGLELYGVAITAVVHCAPPQNTPTPQEIQACRPFLKRTVEALLPHLRGVVALGSIAFRESLRLFREFGWIQTRVRFAHGVLYWQPPAPFLLGSYHPSQQNTFTGRLTFEMLRDVFRLAAQLLEEPIQACPEMLSSLSEFGSNGDRNEGNAGCSKLREERP